MNYISECIYVCKHMNLSEGTNALTQGICIGKSV